MTIGYEDLRNLTEMLANGEQRPDEALNELGIDADAALQIARETATKSMLLVVNGTDPNVVLSALFCAGFTLGVAAAQELEATTA